MNWQANLELFATFALLFVAGWLFLGITRKTSSQSYRPDGQ
jgi:hypothetical protein